MVGAATTAVRLIALTEEARDALGIAEITIERLPFSLGRETRTASLLETRNVPSADRRRRLTPALNDVYLVESTTPHQVSREHLRIDFTRAKYVLTDRGSACGTTVRGQTIGGARRGGHIELHDQDEVVVGNATSPFVFKFCIG